MHFYDMKMNVSTTNNDLESMKRYYIDCCMLDLPKADIIEFVDKQSLYIISYHDLRQFVCIVGYKSSLRLHLAQSSLINLRASYNCSLG